MEERRTERSELEDGVEFVERDAAAALEEALRLMDRPRDAEHARRRAAALSAVAQAGRERLEKTPIPAEPLARGLDWLTAYVTKITHGTGEAVDVETDAVRAIAAAAAGYARARMGLEEAMNVLQMAAESAARLNTGRLSHDRAALQALLRSAGDRAATALEAVPPAALVVRQDVVNAVRVLHARVDGALKHPEPNVVEAWAVAQRLLRSIERATRALITALRAGGAVEAPREEA